jgi:hypothetical protein
MTLFIGSTVAHIQTCIYTNLYLCDAISQQRQKLILTEHVHPRAFAFSSFDPAASYVRYMIAAAFQLARLRATAS